MFALLRNQSKSAAGAITYVTIGTLLTIWAGLWYYYFIMPDPNAPTWQRFACTGVLLSGLAVAAIGLLFGLIGRRAKAADNTVGVAHPGPVIPMVAGGVTVPGVATAVPTLGATTDVSMVRS